MITHHLAFLLMFPTLTDDDRPLSPPLVLYFEPLQDNLKIQARNTTPTHYHHGPSKTKVNRTYPHSLQPLHKIQLTLLFDRDTTNSQKYNFCLQTIDTYRIRRKMMPTTQSLLPTLMHFCRLSMACKTARRTSLQN